MKLELALSCLVAMLAGCAADASAPAPLTEEPTEFVEPEDDGKADGTTQLYLYFKLPSSGEVRLRERSTTPFPGAPSPLTDFVCGPRFTWQGVERVECKRDVASIEVLFTTESKTSVTIFRPSGRTSNQRTFYTCTTKNVRSPFPTYLRCTYVKPNQSGGLQSPIPSTVSGVPIPNAHWVGEGDSVLRAMAPRNPVDYQALVDRGVGAVLIFKKPTGTEVNRELTELGNRGFDGASLLNIPFLWKDFADFATPCHETIEALRFIDAQTQSGRKVFFHCTVGEDRTGYLAAIYRLLRDPQQSLQSVFHGEMCERGYASGNPFKPIAVTSEITQDLTPLFRKMVFKIRSGQLTPALHDSVCDTDPQESPDFASSAELAESAFVCGTSTQFRPN